MTIGQPKNTVLSVVYEYIPIKYVDPCCTPPWITPLILHQIHKKVNTRKRFLSRGSGYFKEKFNKLRADVKKAVQESRELYFSWLGTTLQVNPKCFWSVFDIKSSSRTIPTSVSTPDPNNPKNRFYAYSPSSIAKIFNEYFHSTYTKHVATGV